MRPTSVKKLLTILLSLSTLMIASLYCNDPVKPTPAPVGDIELLEPLGGSGKIVKVGDTVTIRWSIHDRNKVGSVAIAYSLDGGVKFTNRQILGNGSFFYPDTTYQWVVDGAQCSENFVLNAWEYNNSACMIGNPSTCASLFDKSEPFAVRQ